MRYRIRIVRAQTAERTVNATSDDAAIEKVQVELEKPYGFLGPWQTASVDIEILGVESSLNGAVDPVTGGPLLLSVKQAATQLGVSQGSLYELLNRGELEYVRIGSRRLIAREALNRFIEANTRTGYSRS